MTDPLISTRPNGTIRSQRSKGRLEFQHTISGLLTKRSHVVEDVKAAQEVLTEAEANVAALDRSLRLLGFTDDPKQYMPKRKNRRVFKKGEMLRETMAELRKSDMPLTSRDISLALLTERGLDVADKRFVNQVTSRIHKALQREAEAGRVKARQHMGRALVWEIGKV